MIIAINTRLLLKNKLEGIGRFSFEILKRITSEHKEHTFIFIFDRLYDQRFVFSDNIIPVVLFPQARHPLLWFWFFEISIPGILEKYNADLFITMDGWLSLKTKVKTLQVLHDLHFVNYPGFIPFQARKYYQFFFPKFIQKAERIVTVSKFCRNEISQKFKIDIEDIDVVYNSTREDYIPICETEKQYVRNKYSEGQLFFLFIGPIHPRKNLPHVLEAFYQYKRRSNDKTKLVVTGSNMWRNFGNAEKSTVSKDVIFTGYLSDIELYKVTASAVCLLYVSFYEGFGMPLLEAMSCNVPVITSDRSAMPEVAGDAAILVNPENIGSITDAMSDIMGNRIDTGGLLVKGQINLKRFSWEASAGNFWNSIIKTVERP